MGIVTGIVVTHGDLAIELLKTARSVFGEFSHCYALTNEAKSPQTLYDELVSVTERVGQSPCIVFVDFFGGSCSHACLRLEMARQDTYVISGVNLPMLLAFLNKREEIPFEDLPEEVVQRAHGSIKLLDPKDF